MQAAQNIIQKRTKSLEKRRTNASIEKPDQKGSHTESVVTNCGAAHFLLLLNFFDFQSQCVRCTRRRRRREGPALHNSPHKRGAHHTTGIFSRLQVDFSTQLHSLAP